MNNIQVTARFKIHAGQIEEFKSIAEQCISSVREKDTGTLQYDWFFSGDESECVVRETYADSDALLQHIANLGDLLAAVVEVSDPSIELYGDPSSELLEATAAFNSPVYSFFKGA